MTYFFFKNKYLYGFFLIFFFVINLLSNGLNYAIYKYKLNTILRKKRIDDIKFFFINNKSNLKDYYDFFFYNQYFGCFNSLLRERNKIIDKFENNLFLKKLIKFGLKKKQLIFNNFTINKKNNIDFFEFIKNKTIAVVGPSHSNKKLGREIDNFDVVVRTNYNINTNQPFEIYGEKTNISYYNSYRVSQKKNTIYNLKDQDFWWVFKSFNDKKKFKNENYFLNSEKFRVAEQPDIEMMNSNPMLIQIALHDIICFKPKKIKLFHCDFYTAKHSYNKNYKNFIFNKKEVLESIRGHEILGNYIYVKNLYEKKIICAEYEVEKILLLNNKAYANLLDEKFNLKK
jgi:hypothetical protein